MVKQQKKNNRKKPSSKGFTANSAKAGKIDALTEYETCDEHRESLMRKRSVQIEPKIAQFRLKYDGFFFGYQIC